MKEIGSEFWESCEPEYIEKSNNILYLLSGRSALRVIIEDILREKIIKKVMLPSYCCESMILPFLQAGVDVEFYPVYPDYIEYNYDNDADVVLLIDFFGYVIDENAEIALREKKNEKFIIYDSTHKIDGNKSVERYSDYSFCSYRKWFYCNCTKAVKYNGFFETTVLPCNDSYIALRDEAANEKMMYMKGISTDKNSFLSKFSAAEEFLENDTYNYAGIPITLDINSIAHKRRNNALYLINGLKGFSQVTLWRNELKYDDIPLFVPILVNTAIRNELRKYLISNQIYCPIHWPKTANHTTETELYDTELSLICDQRYDIDDMDKIISTINQFVESKR